jgi:hypothetical protein
MTQMAVVDPVQAANNALATNIIAVSNVPLGLALMASFTSQVGDYLTGSAEVVSTA